jgi:parallel beta-helix repeat protein
MQVKKGQPVAFMSYVWFDDEHNNGRLTTFRDRLSAEVRMQTGEEFPIFQDRNDMRWGQNWRERIDESLDQVTFLIPFMTPSFFKSPECRDELKKFLKREGKLKRNDLILPVYYVNCEVLNDKTKQAGDELVEAIAARQYADWRDLRFEPFTSPAVGKALSQLAVQIREALERVAGTGKAATKPATREKQLRVPRARVASGQVITPQPGTAKGVRVEERKRRPSSKTEPPTHVVDPMHRGDHPTITKAIRAANPGDRILVRPGLYQEGLVIDKPLEIIGQGDLGEIVIQAEGKNVLLFKTSMDRVVNLTLRQLGGGDWYGVEIAQGRLELEGCDITSKGFTCVAIHGGADPRLRGNRIHDGKEAGVFVYEGGQGTLEDNEIFGNASAGVAIGKGGNPTVRRNRIHDGKASGVFVYEGGQGTVEDNDIFGNALAGVEISEGGNPTVRRNRIHDGKASGVFVYEEGQGTVEDNDIFGNALAGVAIKKGGNPTVRRNRINKNGSYGVHVYSGGAGTVEDNRLGENAKGAWLVSEDSAAKLTRAGNQEQ